MGIFYSALTLLPLHFLATNRFGIVDCYNMASFESWRYGSPFACPSTEGDTSLSPAVMSYMSYSSLPTTSSVDDIINDLDLLLTAGRLQGSDNRAIIRSIVEPMMGDVDKATRAAQQLIFSSPEYHTTNLPRKVDTPREITGYTDKKGPYKAVVVLMLKGGADSFNMLVPKDQCTTADAYEEYVQTRGNLHAIPKNNLTSIYTTGQDCSEFGVNENLPIVADLYNQNEAVFFANVGTLSKQLTKQDNLGVIGFDPFAHNTMEEAFYTADIDNKKPGTGVMGRLLDVLNNQGLHTSANNVNDGMTMLAGDSAFGHPVYTVSTTNRGELNRFATIHNLLDVVKILNGVGEQGNSVLSEHWSSRVASSLFEHSQMREIDAMPEYDLTDYPSTIDIKLTSSFEAVAGYMKSRKYRK